MANVAISGLVSLPSLNGSSLFEVANPNVSSNSVTANQVAQFSANLEYQFQPVVGTLDLSNNIILVQNTLTGMVNTANLTQIRYTSSFSGALLIITSNKTANSGSPPIAFDSALYDTDGYWNGSGDVSKLTIPTGKGIKKVKLYGGTHIQTGTLAAEILFVHNGNLDLPMPATILSVVNGADLIGFLVSPIIPVEDGDYFQIKVFSLTSETIIASANQTYFGIERIE